MSIKYKFSDEVPSVVLVTRLRELSDAITKGSKMIASAFYMSVPAQVDHNADLVLEGAAKRIEDLLKLLKEMDDYLDQGYGTSIGCGSIFHTQIKSAVANDYKIIIEEQHNKRRMYE